MKVYPRYLGIALIGLCAAACGLEAGGLSAAPVVSDLDAGAAVHLDAGSHTKDSPGAVDGSVDSADWTSPDCVLADVDESFTSGITSRWMDVGVTRGAPKTSVEREHVELVPSGSGDHKFGGLWLRTPVTFEAFDVGFRFRVVHDAVRAAADGFTFAWVEADKEDALREVKAGQGLALPKGRRGFAFALDLYRNSGRIADPDAPYYTLLALDPSRGEPGDYPWHLENRAATASFSYGTWHDAKLVLRDGKLSAFVDGAAVIEDAALIGYAPFGGFLGFTAASGGIVSAEDGFAIDHVRARVWKKGPCFL